MPLQAMAWVCIATVAVLAARELRSSLRAGDGRGLAWLGVGVLVVLGVRLLVVAPSTGHESFHAGELLDTILLGRDQGRVRSWGPVSFEVLGALAPAMGGGLDGVARANQILGALGLGCVALFARRLGGANAALACLAVGMLYPPLARITATEDAHPMAALWAWGGLCWLDGWARERSNERIVAAVLCFLLLIFTRQTFYPWAPCAFLIVLARHGPELLRARGFLLAGVVTASVLLVRVGLSLSDATEGASHALLPATLVRPELWGTLLATHPLVDPGAGALVVLPLLVVAPWIGWRGRGRWALWVSLALLWLSSAAFGRPSAAFALRFPVLLLAVLLAGLALSAVVERGARGAPIRGVRPAVFFAVGLAPLVLPGGAHLRTQSDEYREFAYLEEVAGQLPERFTLVEVPRESWSPTVKAPEYIFVARGREMLRAEPDQIGEAMDPILFFEGLNCRVYTYMETAGLTQEDVARVFETDLLDRVLPPVVTGVAPPGAPPTPGRRPTCEALVARAQPLDVPTGAIEPTHDVPFAQYDVSSPVPLRFWRVLREPNPGSSDSRETESELAPSPVPR